MADWTSPLPGTAVEGADTHVEDHNAIVAAITEARSVIDQAEATIASLQGLLDGKADAAHQHDAGDIDSGTFSTARIPALTFGKVTGLQAALDAKADDADLAAKADTAVTDDHETRIAALEAAGGA